jgi:hypothetical protein
VAARRLGGWDSCRPEGMSPKESLMSMMARRLQNEDFEMSVCLVYSVQVLC